MVGAGRPACVADTVGRAGLIPSKAAWRLDGLELAEVQIADFPQRLGGRRLLQRKRKLTPTFRCRFDLSRLRVVVGKAV